MTLYFQLLKTTQQARISFYQKHVICALFCREETVNNSPTANPIGRWSLGVKRTNIDGCHAWSSFLWSAGALKEFYHERDSSSLLWVMHLRRKDGLKGTCIITGSGSWDRWLRVTSEEADASSKSKTACLQRGWRAKEKSNTFSSLGRSRGMQMIMSPFQGGGFFPMHSSFLNREGLSVRKGWKETLTRSGNSGQVIIVSKAWFPDL